MFSPSIVRFLFLSLLGAFTLHGADFSTYRGLTFGASLVSVQKLNAARSAEVKTLHQRPALIQEMEWLPRTGLDVKTDSVKEGLLYFFNGELFRIVVTYDRYRIEGMTTLDVIDGISASYGPYTKPAAQVAFHSNYSETAAVLARWEDAGFTYDLVRTGDQSSYVLILYSKNLDRLAQAAILESNRLDIVEAPQREIARRKKQEEDDRLAQEATRLLNKPNFRP